VVERTGLQKKLSDLAGEEQRRLGRELHDTIAQEVAGLRMLAETLRHRMEQGTAEPSDADELVEIAAQTQRHIRSLARGLVPAIIDAGGLRSALEQLVERIGEEHGLSCEFSNPQRVVIEDSSVATNLYYIAQEAVRNAVSHGSARRVTIELATDGEVLTLRVADDGSGFRADEAVIGQGSGLRIMDYRARLIGGTVEISSEPGDGTVVVCRVDDDSDTDDAAQPPWQIGSAGDRTSS
jgi:signal transduction histidine kinase